MSIEVTHSNCASEAQVVAEISGNGFTAAARDYKTGKTEPHRHDYDICLHILEGEFRLTEVDEGVMHSFRAGDRFLVPAGMLHFEDHGPLRLVVGRRNLEEGSA